MKDNLIYTAPWIFPVSSPGIPDGAIVVNAHRILAVGSRKSTLQDYPNCKIIELSGVLTPPLINGHIHLELSYLKNMERPPKGSSMVEWIENLLLMRQGVEEITIHQSRQDTVTDQFNSGVILIADVANSITTPSGYTNCPLADGYPEIFSFLELLGPTQQRTADVLKGLSSEDNLQFISPHAPYSTTAHLIITLKNRAREKNHPFTIHLAESCDEIKFIREKRGVFKEFLKQRKSWDSDILGDGRYSGAVDYLDKIGVLDDKTICVHCVHVKDDEISLLARNKSKVCLCPGSNEFLRVGRAPLEKMLQQKILPAIGTDSYASNDSLDIWREMQIIGRMYPSVPSATIFAMATLGGANALQRSDDYGTLNPGRKPVFLEIALNGAENMKENEILKILTYDGRPDCINWVMTADI